MTATTPFELDRSSSIPSTPPPPYEAYLQDYLPAQPRTPIYSQSDQPRSQPYLPVRSAQDESWQPDRASTSALLANDFQHGSALQPSNDCAIARSMCQGAAFCDRIASLLNDVLARTEEENDDYRESRDVETLTQRLMIENTTIISNTRSTTHPSKGSKKSRGTNHEQPRQISLIDFRKTWMYANSRLPPAMLPFKVYTPTWSILSRAAAASAAVYTRPQQSAQRQQPPHAQTTYIPADWRSGTKAMALKTFCLDEKNLVVLAVRGSKWNLVDWAVNFRPQPTSPKGFLDDGGNACHAGFLQVARAMIAPVAARLRQILQQDPSRAGASLVITGHSAGGAVAALLYMHMLSTSPSCSSELNVLTECFRRVHCVTFGAPPVSLLPLQKPHAERWRKSLFFAFANEGDPVVRVDREYICSLTRLLAAPAPEVRGPLDGGKSSRRTGVAPIWPVPEATLSNAGRLVLLRRKPADRKVVEAVCVSDGQLRNVVFGDPGMHEMEVYWRRIDELAFAAVTGRD